jgi:ribose transport system ATP-binding protein
MLYAAKIRLTTLLISLPSNQLNAQVSSLKLLCHTPVADGSRWGGAPPEMGPAVTAAMAGKEETSRREGRNLSMDAPGHTVVAGAPSNGRGDGAPSGETDALLAVSGISKRFGGTQALDNVGMTVNAGEIVALLGENGAGKSTLIKILASVYTLDQGAVSYRGRDVTASLRRMPVAFIHQDLGLIDWMTVAENICLTLGYPRRGGMVDFKAARKRAADALEALGADIDPDLRINNLTRTEKSLVAIARALASEAEVLVLDEPTASLPADEVARLFGALRRLRSRGVGMIYVSHRLDEVFEIADRMVVLRDGRVAGERRISETTPEETILLIVGREPSQVFRRPALREGAARLRLEGLMVDSVGPVDLALHSGEVVGLVGLRGAGQEVIGRALFGLVPITGGTVALDGAPLRIASPREAMEKGINLICADRVGESVTPNRTVRENLFLNPLAAGLGIWSYLAPGRETRAAHDLGQLVGLRPNDPGLAIELLSGGNQQKVVVGRWLHLASKVYIFEDPTAGVDVGAKAEIYRLFDVALQEGAAIIIISTDFEEVAKVCHRALIFDRGRVVAELGAGDLSVENLLATASARVGRMTKAADTPTSVGAHAIT